MNRTSLICAAIVSTLLSAPAQAAGFNNSDGYSAETNGVEYYHGSDGNNGWQTQGGGGNFYHDDRKNCFTNTLSTGASFTHCNDY
jgi:hypothetical protein